MTIRFFLSDCVSPVFLNIEKIDRNLRSNFKIKLLRHNLFFKPLNNFSLVPLRQLQGIYFPMYKIEDFNTPWLSFVCIISIHFNAMFNLTLCLTNLFNLPSIRLSSFASLDHLLYPTLILHLLQVQRYRDFEGPQTEKLIKQQSL